MNLPGGPFFISPPCACIGSGCFKHFHYTTTATKNPFKIYLSVTIGRTEHYRISRESERVGLQKER